MSRTPLCRCVRSNPHGTPRPLTRERSSVAPCLALRARCGLSRLPEVSRACWHWLSRWERWGLPRAPSAQTRRTQAGLSCSRVAGSLNSGSTWLDINGIDAGDRRPAALPDGSLESSPGTWCKSSAPASSVRTSAAQAAWSSGHLLLDLLVCVIVWSCQDERDRLG